jgi:hypothetical protein
MNDQSMQKKKDTKGRKRTTIVALLLRHKGIFNLFHTFKWTHQHHLGASTHYHTY